MQRTAIVTGAGGGVGASCARRLAANGLRVVLVGRTQATLDAVASSIGEGATAITLDVTGSLDAIAKVDADVLVHAAAAYAPYDRIERVDPEAARRVYEAGPIAASRLCAALLPGMRARRFGRLVLLGSVVASVGGHGQAAYAGAKAALIGLARSVALEAGRDGVTANVVELGVIDTARVRGAMKPEAVDAIVRATPARRLGSPEEAAALVAFLCSDGAAFVTGAAIPMTGGLGLGLL